MFCEPKGKLERIEKIASDQYRQNFSFLFIGDFGWVENNVDRFPELPAKVVMKSMNSYAGSNRFDMIFTAGDNFYPRINSSLDKDGYTSISFISNQPNLANLPIFLTYGNHDCYTSYKFGKQLEMLYPNVYMPTPPFNLTVKIGESLVDFSFLSCDLFCLGPSDWHMKRQCNMMKTTSKSNKLEYKWLENHLKSIQSNEKIIWKVVFVHFPIFSISTSSGDAEGQKLYLFPLLKKYGVDIVLSGHNHNMEHFMSDLRNPGKYIPQDYNSTCLKETHLSCRPDLKLTCQHHNVTCSEKKTTCKDRQIFDGFYSRFPLGEKILVKQGLFFHQVIQGAGGGILDPLCDVVSPMSNLSFALADYGFSDIFISEEKMIIRYIHANSSKVVFETIIESNSFE